MSEKNSSGSFPPWVEPCGYCEDDMDMYEYYVFLELKEVEGEYEKVLLETALCSNDCLKRVFSYGPNFVKKLKHFEKGEWEKRKVETDDPMPLCCSYCGKYFKQWEDYHIRLEIEGKKIDDPDLPALVVINTFCSKACYEKALGLGHKYLDYSLSAYSPEDCIVEQLKNE